MAHSPAPQGPSSSPGWVSLCLALLLFASAPVAAAESAESSRDEIDAALAQLETGTLERRVEAARWLGLNLVDEALEPLSRLAYAPGVDLDADTLARTAALMVELLRRPRLLRYRSSTEVLEQLDAPDDRARADAVRHVPYFGLDEAVPAVVGCLSDPVPLVREEALVALTLLRVDGHGKRALALLDDDEGVVRLRAFEYLDRVVPDPPLRRMVELAADPDVWVARPAIRSLASGPHSTAARAAMIEAAVRSDAPSRTTRFLEALGSFGSPAEWSAEERTAVTEFLTDDDEDVRLAAALLTIDGGDDRARQVLLSLLGSPDESRRLRSARGLAEARPVPDVATIRRVLGDPSFEVRRAGLMLSTELPPRQRRRLYVEVLERPDEHDEVLSLVLSLFPEVGEDDDAELILTRARETHSHFLRINAVTALALLEQRTGGTLGRSWYAEVLGDADEDFTVKTAVLNALQVVGDSDDLGLLTSELRACPAEQSGYADALVKTISILIGRRIHGPTFGEECGR